MILQHLIYWLAIQFFYSFIYKITIMEQKSNADLEEDLMSHLSATNLGEEHLASIAKTIASSNAAGIKLVDWWIIGIPAFERIVLQTHLPIDQSDAIKNLVQNERFKGIDIWRKGIPKPDFFQINITIDKVTTKPPQI